ncbi:hypothetical protein HK405_012826, partial [Cladochytrium tenue]
HDLVRAAYDEEELGAEAEKKLPPVIGPRRQDASKLTKLDPDAPFHIRAYRWTVDTSTRYYKWIIACHFAFIVFDCIVVFAITLKVDTTDASVQANVATSYINCAKYISILTTPFWVGATIVTLSETANYYNQRFWGQILRLTRRARFWLWYFLFNVFQLCLWMVILVLFWDSNFICYKRGDGADLNPFEGTCDELTNIWFYALFQIAIFLFNCYMVVNDELKVSVDEALESKVNA